MNLYGFVANNPVFVAAATESPAHDADGNLTQDGRWTYTWDGENRLVQMIRDTASPSGARQKLVFEYDHQGRRIRKTFSTYSGGWQEQSDLIFLYDGWNLVGEFDANASNVKVRTYVWGTDLSGTTTGAGGVGGLLWLNNHQSTFEGKTLPTGVQYAAYDGNGNVAALVKATDGSVTARYDYGPFAEPIRASGPMAKANPIRFSTKYTDYQSGLVYYGYRYYGPTIGRWPSRDPIGEVGDENLYGFVENDPSDFVDFNGLTIVKKHAWSITQQQAMSGIWGWTDLESQEEKPAKLKMKKKLCLCVVTKKPEMVFTISVQTARSGKQSWKESAVFDGVTYPDTSVYVGSGLASFSTQHEEKRFQARKKAYEAFWPAHYEDPAAKLTAPTCDELQAKIDALRQKAAADWETSPEGWEMVRRLFEIGQESASVSRWVRKSGFGSVRVVYDTE